VNSRSGPSQPRQQPAPAQQRAPAPSSQSRDDPQNIENIRQQILTNPRHAESLRSTAPDLADVVNDPERFRVMWLERVARETQAQRAHEDEMRQLNADPFNADSQKRIAEMIRRENIERNLQYAYENNPAGNFPHNIQTKQNLTCILVFTQVHMLYVPVIVNDHPIKAFVDSGAQTTIMSPHCAEACGLTNLIDERYSGIARGVGTAKIIGKIHNAKIQVGDAELDCAFTVMEGKDVELLFGLDMLKRHQACIDLKVNKLCFPHTEVEFLSENEIPRAEASKMLDEPTVKGPDGTEIGARSGTIRPQGTAAAAHQQLQNPDNKGKTQPPAQSTTPVPAVASSSTAAPPTVPAGNASKYPEADVNQLIALGFTREDAIRALDATSGNVEYAAGLLFAR
jgi:DNA damage-inducible protein 1